MSNHSESDRSKGPPRGVRLWLAGARPRTLPAAVVPVAVGTACATPAPIIWWRAGCALGVALALQVATNYANDYSDGVRGTDEVRVGPVRLVASRLATPTAVKRAAMLAFGVAGALGLALAAAVSWWLLVVGAASIAAGWLYTGGPRPYGYAGFGEVFVFVFFGLVATAGSEYVQARSLSGLAVLASIPVGLLAVSLLVINNLRDIPGDTTAGKRTVAVRLGDGRTRVLYAGLIVIAFAAVVVVGVDRPWALIGLLAALLALTPVGAVRRGASGRDLVPVLGLTSRLQIAVGVLFTLGIALGAH